MIGTVATIPVREVIQETHLMGSFLHMADRLIAVDEGEGAIEAPIDIRAHPLSLSNSKRTSTWHRTQSPCSSVRGHQQARSFPRSSDKLSAPSFSRRSNHSRYFARQVRAG